jgi:inward rectifier potassium channel
MSKGSAEQKQDDKGNLLNTLFRAFDPGLGQRYEGKVERVINKDGTFNVRRIGMRKHLYQSMINADKYWFYASMVLFYLVINALFALIYLAIGIDKLGVVNDVVHTNDFLTALFFSMQTFTTVGYGSYYPIDYWANLIAGLEAMTGWIFFAISTGLVYGRFAKPSARILFSNNALIAPYQDIRSLQFRLVNRRSNVLLDLEARVMLVANDLSGNSVNRKYYNLRLEISTIHFFPLSWTVVHPIDEKSPLYGITKEELKKANAEVLILIKAFDETFGQHVHVRFSYRWDEMVWGAKFVRNFHTDSNGEVVVDVDGVHNYTMVVEGEGEDV